MSTIQQILPNEEGFIDYSKAAVAEPPRPITPPSTPEADRVILNSIAATVESLLKELKRKPSNERTVEIERLLRAKTPALLAQVVSTRRLKTGVSRQASDTFESVRAGRSKQLAITLAAREELVGLVVEALELFRGECQNEAVS